MSICTRCEGTGQAKEPLDDTGTEHLVTCPDCEGTGAKHTGWLVEVELEQGETEPPLPVE